MPEPINPETRRTMLYISAFFLMDAVVAFLYAYFNQAGALALEAFFGAAVCLLVAVAIPSVIFVDWWYNRPQDLRKSRSRE